MSLWVGLVASSPWRHIVLVALRPWAHVLLLASTSPATLVVVPPPPSTGRGRASAKRGRLRREAARVVLLAPDNSVLLLSGRDPSGAGVGPFWLVPGGGAKEGEAPEDAARREAYEELGTRLGDLGPPVWRRHTSFVFDGWLYDQKELFFVVRTPRFTPVPTALTELERRFTTGARWWPLAELATTTETIFPAQLAELVEAWLSAGPPPTPLPID